MDPVDPVAVLRMLVDGLAATEASIIRLQAVKEVHLAVAHRLADEIGSVDGGAARGESAELAARSVAADSPPSCTCPTGWCRAGWAARRS